MSNKLLGLAWRNMPALSIRGRLAYIYFCDAARDRYDWRAWVTLQELMAVLGCGERVALRALAELRAHHLLERRTRHGAHGVTMYQVYAPEWISPAQGDANTVAHLTNLTGDDMTPVTGEENHLTIQAGQVSVLSGEVSVLSGDVPIIDIPIITQLLPTRTHTRAKLNGRAETAKLAPNPPPLRGPPPDEMPSVCWRGTPAGMRAWVSSRQGATIMQDAGEHIAPDTGQYLPSRVMRHYRAWCKDQGIDCSI